MTQSACQACPLALNAAIVAAQAIRDAAGQRTCTVIVDAGNDAVEIPPEDIEPPPSSGARIRADCIPDMDKVRGRFVILLKLERVISLEEQPAAEPEPAWRERWCDPRLDDSKCPACLTA